MKFAFLIICFLFVLLNSGTAEDVPGGTISGATWTAENSPYIILGNITVADLTIEAGVIVQFTDNYYQGIVLFATIR